MFLLLGIGAGAVYAAFGLGLVLTYRATGVVNFAHGAMAMVVTYVFVEVRQRGDLVLPVPGLSARLHIGDDPPLGVSFALALIVAALLGLATYLLVFRPLRRAPPLASVVASVGLMLALQAAAVGRFGTASRSVPAILPARPLALAGHTLPSDRVLLALLAIVAAGVLWAAGRFTRAGLVVRAAADDEVGVALMGFSPDVVGASTTAVATVLAGAAGVLAGPITALNPVTSTLLVVPALAAALVGRLRSFGITVAAALVLGMAQSGVVLLQTRIEALPRLGLQAGLPVLLVVVALATTGSRFGRGRERRREAGTHRRRRLPSSPRPRSPLTAGAVGVVAGSLALAVTTGTTRAALVHSMIAAVVCLSIVVLTGYVGQISLAQMAFAGIGGFALSRLAAGAGIPFPVAPLLAAMVAALAGVAVGLPALGLRDTGLAVVTLASAVAVEELVFKQVAISGGFAGTAVPAPSILGMDLGPGAGTGPTLAFGLFVLVLLAGAALAVAFLRRGSVGRRLLTVRANERAAEALGVAVARAKLSAFALSAFLAGLAGTLIGYEEGRLSFESFGVFVSLAYLAVTYLGGIAGVSGALVGGALVPGGILFAALDRTGGLGRHQLLVTGVALVAVTILFPDGITGALLRVAARRRPPPSDASPASFSSESPTETVGDSLENGPGPGATASPPARVPARPILEIDGVSVAFGGTRALDDVSMQVHGGAVTGLIGPNGAGKTTLLDAAGGFIPLESGTMSLAGRPLDGAAPHERAGLGLARTFQSLELFEDLTVHEQLLAAVEATWPRRRRPRRRWGGRSDSEEGAGPSRPERGHGVIRTPERGHGVIRWPDRGHGVASTPATPVHLALVAARAAGVDHLLERRPAELPHGDRKRVALARALAAAPRLLLLDEPAAGLDPAARRELAERVRAVAENGAAVLVADHDMDLVFEVCDEVWVLDQGRVVAHGSPATVRTDPGVIAAYLGNEAAGPRKSPGRPALEPTGPGRQTDPTQAPTQADPTQADPTQAGAGAPVDAQPVLEITGLVAGYGGAPVVHGIDLRVHAGEVVALLGRNGAGKTTTVLAATGLLVPLAGEVRAVGEVVTPRPHRLAARGAALVPQGRRVFPALTVDEHLRLAGGSPDRARAAFPALAPLGDRPAGLLSGGEQQMLALATAVAGRPRLLVVDELSLGLAPRLAAELLRTLRGLADEGCAVLVVEQHPALALDIADRAVVLERGRVVVEGPASEVASRPGPLRNAYLGR